MAEKLIAPGTFIQENDLSFVPAGINAIGAAFIGPTLKGRAFVPTKVSNYNEFLTKFGGTDGYILLPYAVREYLKTSGVATIVKILGYGGFKFQKPAVLTISSSIEGFKIAAVLAPTNDSVSSSLGASLVPLAASASNFLLHLSGSDGATALSTSFHSMSFAESSANKFTNIFTQNPYLSQSAYAYLYFPEVISRSMGDATAKITLNAATNFNFFADYTHASTPWIVSQISVGQTYQLIKLHTIGHGNNANREIKAGIFDIKPSGSVAGSEYGSFGIVVREFNDTDKVPTVLETFANLNLDPDSPNYVARVIGDKSVLWNTTLDKLVPSGNYENNSQYIRVEVHPNIEAKAYSPGLVPYGFEAYYSPIPTSTNNVPVRFFTVATSSKDYFGFNTTLIDNLQYLNPIPSSNSTTGSNTAFTLSGSITYNGVGIPASPTGSLVSSNKFIVTFQGGFDGVNPTTRKINDGSSTNALGYVVDTGTSGSLSWNDGIDVVSDPRQYDINLIVTPGINAKQHLNVVTNAIETCEDRGDCMYVLDAAGKDDNLSVHISNISTLDTSYAATYYPWVKIMDVDRNKPMWVPPSVIIPSVYSYNDKIGYEWFAPAGYNRGLLTTIMDIKEFLNQSDLETLYSGRMNPIATFMGDYVVWGNKTMQTKPTALDRINVRRLLIKAKKFIASVTKYLVFDNNVISTRNSFVNQVTPFFDNIASKNGLYAFKVIMDETNNTPDVIDRNILKGAIFIQPAKSIEFVQIDFNITNTGASFGV